MSRLLNVSDAASLALHAMIVLARTADDMVVTHRIAAELGVSESHLAKVMQRLVKCRLVDSVRGPHGGFALSRRAETIRLLDIYQAIDGDLPAGGCLFGTPLCDGRTCVFGPMLDKVHVMVSGYFSQTTLAKVVKLYKRGRDDKKKHRSHR